ncbi:MAG: sulfite exporter TauE/SafE family protein [Armatimonadetes bacterium]|nr:sulfite exporter TauE/SafE family protein [Armatimonadota bacterium]
MADLILCFVLGAVAGASSGIFGIGGGLIIVPALIAFFKFSPQKATGTSLAALLAPVGIFAVINYYRANSADLRLAVAIASGYLASAYLGSRVALSTNSHTLKLAFGCLLVIIGILMVTEKI